LRVTYTEEAIADIVEAISYLNERNPTAAAKLDAEIAYCLALRALTTLLLTKADVMAINVSLRLQRRR
jgi:plasmid stabilization system protein ParE